MRGIIQSTDIDLSGYAKLSDLEEGHNYSTNEQVVGTWIDGKPLYEKTLAITVTTDYESVTLADEGITNIDFATMSEYTVVDNNGIVFPLNSTYQSGVSVGDIQFASGFIVLDGGNSSLEIQIAGGTATLPVTIYVTLHYTKTTDTV